MHEHEELIITYFNGTYFLFFPNICNANCKFCYLQPKYSKKARLSYRLINRINDILIIMQRLGFKEVRITGGEPLVYENYDDIICILNKHNIRYSIATNGINLCLFKKAFLRFPPEHLFISFPSIDYRHGSCTEEITTKSIENDIAFLAREGIDVIIGIVFKENSIYEVPEIVKKYIAMGISSFKLIYPNTKYHENKLIENFEDCKIILKQSFNDVKIYATRFDADSCLLSKEGFLSINTANFKATPCCVLMKSGPFVELEYCDVDNFLVAIKRIYSDAIIKRTCFPCKTYFSNCPLALENIFTCSKINTDYSS